MENQHIEDVDYLPSVSFDDLPDELLPFIFRYLALKDLIKCRLVSPNSTSLIISSFRLFNLFAFFHL